MALSNATSWRDVRGLLRAHDGMQLPPVNVAALYTALARTLADGGGAGTHGGGAAAGGGGFGRRGFGRIRAAFPDGTGIGSDGSGMAQVPASAASTSFMPQRADGRAGRGAAASGHDAAAAGAVALPLSWRGPLLELLPPHTHAELRPLLNALSMAAAVAAPCMVGTATQCMVGVAQRMVDAVL